ncbi:MAG: saccharopine dehydrogenase family protein [Vulcanisaeta sp.]
MCARYLVLGGAGDMGGAVVKDLYLSNVDEVVIADLNKDAADKLASELRNAGSSSTKISVIKLDINDERALIDAAKDSDIVINTVGPFYKYEKIVIGALMKVERDYVDINDDYDATLEILKLSDAIRSSGSRVLIGMGWTPGITNVCARAGYEYLDETDEINIAWVGSAADARGLAVILHTFHAVTGNVPMYLDGELTYVPALQSKMTVEFPEPIGKVDVYYTGHPEPITIPRFLKGVRNVTIRGGLVPDWQNTLLRQLAIIGLTEDKEVDVHGVKISAREFLAHFVHQTYEQFRSGGVEASGFWVEVKGKRNGVLTIVRYSGADRMYKLTGWSASIGAQYLVRNRSSISPGLYAPEGVIEPTWFINELKRRGIRVRREVIIVED